MAFFEVKQKLHDSINGYDFLRGEYIETNELVWVRRFGPDLVEIKQLPEKATLNFVVNTTEQRTADKVEAEKVKQLVENTAQKEKVEPVESEKEKVEISPKKATVRAVTRPIVDKVVRSGESDNK